ncbi:hypothetical protein SI65_01077 [Aspergillus cristatus]|uniref:Uncharacterized protein n=1 Tax=Aspergillus cristatus TaxID=573508 RepID=A0A1E3BRC0_ASPCR|nr:hypothetical protein SI65_01077 [Aspergillus cristatus]
MPTINMIALSLYSYRDPDDSDKYDTKPLTLRYLYFLDNSIATSIAEHRFAEWIKRLEEYKYKITPDERARVWKDTDMCHFAPDPRRDIRVVPGSLAHLFTAYPPYYDGQSRMVEFVKVLKELPRHEMVLWPIDASWESIYTYFKDELSMWSARYRLRNLNSAMASLTSSNLIDCSGLSALRQLRSDSPEYPDLEEEPIEGSYEPEILILSAAQWVVWPDECRWVYRQCKQAESESVTELGMWSMERWKDWKKEFEFVMLGHRFAQWIKVRDVAERVYRQKLMIEEEYEHK